MGQAFSGYHIEHGTRIDLDDNFPAYGVGYERNWWHESEWTSFVLAEQKTVVTVEATSYIFILHPGMYAMIPGKFMLGGGRGLIVTRDGYRGMFMVGGPLEEHGRLKYIDGCTDSLLIPPVKRGDPCLNLLYFPPGIDQTEHTHPSDRFGLVVSGHGRCLHRASSDAPFLSIDLVPGMIWRIHTDGLHKFQTPYDRAMRVVAFHPDSDFGPTDEDHPMLNRTIVEGVSAADASLAGIRTQ
jgi:hypothetical protein